LRISRSGEPHNIKYKGEIIMVDTKRVQVYIPPEDLKQVKVKLINKYGKSNISELTRQMFKLYLNEEIEVELDI
jgi:hypothetical protein